MIEFTRQSGVKNFIVVDKVVKISEVHNHKNLTNITLITGEIISVIGHINEVKNKIEEAK